MEKEAVKKYFDEHAASWDSEMIRNDEIINIILNNAAIEPGHKVLDVACGTGVLIPDYLKRNVASVTGADISEEMIKAARLKFNLPNVKFICCDIETTDPGEKYDNVVIYNAFPHFPNPEKLMENLSRVLVPGGTFTIAHGMNRSKINAHHNNSSAHKISNDLISADDLAEIMSEYFDVTFKHDSQQYYQLVGVKK